MGCPPLRLLVGDFMIDAMTNIWSLMTIFFNTSVIYQPLFMGMILMITIFYLFYLVRDLLDFSEWGDKF